MRCLRGSLHWGLCPQTRGMYRFFPARMAISGFHGDRCDHLSPAFPAAEPVARVASLRCPIPSGSGRLSINHAVGALNEKAANGDYPLSFVSHPLGFTAESCIRPSTPARFRALPKAVLIDVIGRVGSRWFARPNGKRYQSGSIRPKRRTYLPRVVRVRPAAAGSTEWSDFLRPPSCFCQPSGTSFRDRYEATSSS